MTAFAERSCVRHDQLPNWTGCARLFGIDRTDLYHWGVARCLARIVGSRLRLRVMRARSVCRAGWPPERAEGQRPAPRTSSQPTAPRSARRHFIRIYNVGMLILLTKVAA